MKRIYLLLLSFLASFSVFGQTIPNLSKDWNGVSNHTFLEDKSNGGIQKKSVPATYQVLKQDGRSVLLLFKSELTQSKVIGTISVDGKQLSIAYYGGAGIYNLNGKSMQGCGVTTKFDKAAKNGVAPYTTWCDEFTAVD
jgi:hypothetical protein